MHTRMIIAALLVALTTMGFDCFNDDPEVAINLDPFNQCYFVNTGTSHDYGGSTVIDSKTLYDQSYTLTGAGLYDLTVQTVGTDLGTVTSGTVTFSVGSGPPIQLATYSGTWTDFSSPQSVLTSPHVQLISTGILMLAQAVVDKDSVTLTGAGTIQTIPPTSTESSVCVNAFVQAYGHP